MVLCECELKTMNLITLSKDADHYTKHIKLITMIYPIKTLFLNKIKKHVS